MLNFRALCNAMEEACSKSESFDVILGGCRQYFDGLLCWPDTEADTEIIQTCPPTLNGITYIGNVTKYCNSNGTYGKANYTACKPDWEYMKKVIFNYSTYCIRFLALIFK